MIGELLASMLDGSLHEVEPGPVKWCKRCSRKHRVRTRCNLVLVAVPAKSGRLVRRWAHP